VVLAPGDGYVLPVCRNWSCVQRTSGDEATPDWPDAASHHAVLARSGDSWYVEDLSGGDAVLVNGLPVVARRLCDGDELQVGDVTMVLHTGGRRASAPTCPSVAGPVERADVHCSGRLGSMVDLGGLAVAVRTLPALMDGLAENLARLLGAERVVPVLRGSGDLWRAYHAEAMAFFDAPEELGIDRQLLEQACSSGPVTCSLRDGQVRSVACVPIWVGNEDLGAIYCERVDPPRPFAHDELEHLSCVAVGVGLSVHRLESQQQLASRTHSLSRQLDEHYKMLGRSPAMLDVRRFIDRVAPTDAGVLVCGESGTGKEIVARKIHRHSRRSTGPLEVVNCAAVPRNLIDSELLGHIRGAFTGAIADRPGRFELADGGTLFLDEVAELPLDCQAKLLRVIEEGKVRRVGDTKDKAVNVRVIAATSRDPRTALKSGRLRSDLFYRLDRLRVVVPPLRARDGDIPLLAEHFRQKFSHQCNRSVGGFTPEVLQLFRAYHWPGNVREIRNVVERMVILAEGERLGPELIPEDIRSAVAGHVPKPLRVVEREYIGRILREAGGNKKRAAELLGINRTTLYARMRRYRLDA
jgi:transcriptional regulator with GAF, ATPase, and Fis domain